MAKLTVSVPIFGEIALFSPEHVRTNTVRCLTRCVVLSIHESTVRQLYFQNPAFGFHLIELLAARLSTDVKSVEQRWAESTLSGVPPQSVVDAVKAAMGGTPPPAGS